MIKRIIVRLLARRTKATNDHSRTSLIEDRVLPPVSTATGGVKPGIDLNNTAALQEAADCDYADKCLNSTDTPH